MVNIRRLHPEHGDQVMEALSAEQAADVILETRDNGWARFAILEGETKEEDKQLELQMATKAGLIDYLKDKAEQTLRLVPVSGGG